MSRLSLRRLAAVSALAWLGAGCTGESQPSTFYLLTYEQDLSESGSITTMRQGPSLAIGPVDFPDYLDRPQMVTRANENQLDIQEFDRWGGPLEENFTTVLAEVLSSALETDRIATYPWDSATPVEFQVLVTVTSFGTDAAGRSVLDARWSIIDIDRQEALVTARSTLREEIETAGGSAAQKSDYAAIAAAMSRNVAALGREIARQLPAARG